MKKWLGVPIILSAILFFTGCTGSTDPTVKVVTTAELQTELEALETKLIVLENKQSTAVSPSEFAAVKADAAPTKSDISALKTQVASIQSQIANLPRSISQSQLDAETDEIRKDMNALRVQITTLSTAMDALRNAPQPGYTIGLLANASGQLQITFNASEAMYGAVRLTYIPSTPWKTPLVGGAWVGAPGYAAIDLPVSMTASTSRLSYSFSFEGSSFIINEASITTPGLSIPKGNTVWIINNLAYGVPSATNATTNTSGGNWYAEFIYGIAPTTTTGIGTVIG